MLERREINPTPWLRNFNLHHGIEVSHASRTLYLSGQASTGGDGSAMYPGDIRAQFERAWSELKDALALAEMEPRNIVRLNIYTTDIDALMADAEHISNIWGSEGCQPVCSLLGVQRLFLPELMVELEATAVA